MTYDELTTGEERLRDLLIDAARAAIADCGRAYDLEHYVIGYMIGAAGLPRRSTLARVATEKKSDER